MDFKSTYETCKNTPSDINEHLELLYSLGKQVQNITEFGVGFGRSTKAFIAAIAETGGTLHSYEIKVLEGVSELFAAAQEAGLNAHFCEESTLEAEIAETDLLLIDSHHTFDQVWNELQKHSDKVKKFIVFHDTELYGISGQDQGSIGIWPAIYQWMESHGEWQIKEQRYNNNGLLVLEKK